MNDPTEPIWNTSGDGQEIEVYYNGISARVITNGEETLEVRPVEVDNLIRRRLKLPADIVFLIGPVMFRKDEAAIVRAKIRMIAEEARAEQARKLEAALPGLAIVRESLTKIAAFEQAMARLKQAESGAAHVIPMKPPINLGNLIHENPAAYLYVRIESALQTSTNQARTIALMKARDHLAAGGSAEEARLLAGRWIS